MPKTTTKLPKEGDKVFVIDDRSFEISERKVAEVPSELIWVFIDRSRIAIGPHRWALTKKEATEKALKLATNHRQALTDRISEIDSIIKKLGGNK